MPSCIVKGCTNRSSTKSYRQEEFEKTMKVTFHAFPKCPMKHQLWLNSLGLQNSVLPKRPIVCSLHFRHEDIDRTSLACVRLRENAIPYVNFLEIIKKENIVYEEISTEEPLTSEIIKQENINVYEEISTEEPPTSEIIKQENINVYEEISTEEPPTSKIIKQENINVCEEISTEEPSISEIIKEENINECEKISTEEPSTSICSDSCNMSSAVIILETGDSVRFTEPMSITGGKRRHLVDTGSHEVNEKVLKIESESKNVHMHYCKRQINRLKQKW